MPMKIEKNQNLTGNRLVGGASTVAILVLILNMQACGGGESTVETSSLTPSQADLVKDWKDDGADSETATGKGSRP